MWCYLMITPVSFQGLLSGWHPAGAEWSGDPYRHGGRHLHWLFHGSAVRWGEEQQSHEGPGSRVGNGVLNIILKREKHTWTKLWACCFDICSHICQLLKCFLFITSQNFFFPYLSYHHTCNFFLFSGYDLLLQEDLGSDLPCHLHVFWSFL